MSTDCMMPTTSLEKPFKIEIDWEGEFKERSKQEIVWFTDKSKTDTGTGAGVHGQSPRYDISHPLGVYTTKMNYSNMAVLFTCCWIVSRRIILSNPIRMAEEDFRYYNIGVLMASQMNYPFDLERCGPAIDMALEEVNEKFLYQHRIKLTKVQSSYPSCSGSVAPGLAADMHFLSDIIAFIGPACLFALEPVARLAAYWNIPIITGMGDQPQSEGQISVTSRLLKRYNVKTKSSAAGIFADKSKYPTLTRMSYCQCRLTKVFESIFKQFSWKHIALIFDRSDLFSLTVGKILEHGLRKSGFLAYVKDLDGSETENLVHYLKDASMYSRIVILCVRGPLVREFMLTAHSLDMTNGDYIFLDVEIFQGSYWGAHDWKTGDDNDTSARKAYEALLRVSLLQPTSDKFQEFADKVKQKSFEDYNYTISENEEINFVIGAFYDGVYLLGMALNETLNDGKDIRDGKSITERMWNRTFSGITGQVRIDSNGDRDADYSILDLNPITGKFEVVGHYKGSSKEYIPVSFIHWPGNQLEAPPDMPRCGFMGNSPECKNYDYYVFVHGSILFGAIIAFCAALVFCVFRRSRRSLNDTSWKIRLEELYSIPNLTGPPSSEPYRISSNRSSLSSNSFRHQFTTVKMYRGNKVAIKKAKNKKIDINKKLLMEIRQIKEISHENTVRFIGVCLDCPNPLIITEYCSRGSLKDVLDNKDIKLDWNFRMSLVNDIVKGMIYLHQSEVSVHGKLRSCNCLIDGRFVLKLSDFGLGTLTTPLVIIREAEYFRKLLWVAPELIPLSTNAIIAPTQRGDVYSFGIILEEIILRAGPFQVAREVEKLTIEDIILKVASRECPPFRPVVQIYDCPEKLTELMQISWSDLPEERPIFPQIHQHLRNLMRLFGENIIDDLLIRMEQYANNLEALVNEKTEELSQEKKRTEELLYQVLPRPVAMQLMSGQIVKPEQFECVTIYFSDIVGFTRFCASATPMQVVDLLNELYSTFDKIIKFYDVYKVETIGDAYVVVSGLPQRNGDSHAREIALMALAILSKVKVFSCEHNPDFRLQVRIGIHSGPVCAGVVGHIMPHYCLFGDTVNTASRMESSGMPQKIHLSETTRDILETFGTFELEHRGEVELKGKGTVTTYWLLKSTDIFDFSNYGHSSATTETESAPYPLLYMGQTPPN